MHRIRRIPRHDTRGGSRPGQRSEGVGDNTATAGGVAAAPRARHLQRCGGSWPPGVIGDDMQREWVFLLQRFGGSCPRTRRRWPPIFPRTLGWGAAAAHSHYSIISASGGGFGGFIRIYWEIRGALTVAGPGSSLRGNVASPGDGRDPVHQPRRRVHCSEGLGRQHGDRHVGQGRLLQDRDLERGESRCVGVPWVPRGQLA